jgi:hypothetical protein
VWYQRLVGEASTSPLGQRRFPTVPSRVTVAEDNVCRNAAAAQPDALQVVQWLVQ